MLLFCTNKLRTLIYCRKSCFTTFLLAIGLVTLSLLFLFLHQRASCYYENMPWTNTPGHMRMFMSKLLTLTDAEHSVNIHSDKWSQVQQ